MMLKCCWNPSELVICKQVSKQTDFCSKFLLKCLWNKCSNIKLQDLNSLSVTFLQTRYKSNQGISFEVHMGGVSKGKWNEVTNISTYIFWVNFRKPCYVHAFDLIHSSKINLGFFSCWYFAACNFNFLKKEIKSLICNHYKMTLILCFMSKKGKRTQNKHPK